MILACAAGALGLFFGRLDGSVHGPAMPTSATAVVAKLPGWSHERLALGSRVRLSGDCAEHDDDDDPFVIREITREATSVLVRAERASAHPFGGDARCGAEVPLPSEPVLWVLNPGWREAWRHVSR